jgi:DNA-binding NarL/FixJ family response regulator
MAEAPVEPQIRTVLADDHPLVLDALEQLFRTEGDIEVVARCTRGDQVLPAVRWWHPDVLILDLVMAGGDGISALRQLKAAELRTPTILLTALVREAELVEAIRLGVRGVLLKDTVPQQIAQCVRKVHAGGEWLEQKVVGPAMQSLLRRQEGERAPLDLLTARELDIIRCTAAGLRNKEVADRLAISEGTVKIHLHNIFGKVGVEGRVALTIWARDKGLV